MDVSLSLHLAPICSIYTVLMLAGARYAIMQQSYQHPPLTGPSRVHGPEASVGAIFFRSLSLLVSNVIIFFFGWFLFALCGLHVISDSGFRFLYQLSGLPGIHL